MCAAPSLNLAISHIKMKAVNVMTTKYERVITHNGADTSILIFCFVL